MSLNRIAARIAAVQALKGKTLVDDNVLDSVIGALDISADGKISSNEAKPFIAVYCDESTNKDGPTSDMLRALVPNGTTTFLFEAGVTAAMTVIDPETDQSYVVPDIPATDDTFEFTLDVIMRQVSDALTDPTNEWAEVFRMFCQRYIATERARTSSDDRGTRLAAHQLKLTVDLWPDPARGMELKPGHPLSKFFALAECSGDTLLLRKVEMMRAQLTGDQHAWQLALRRYGMTRGEADALGVLTAEGAEADIAGVDIDVQPVGQVGG